MDDQPPFPVTHQTISVAAEAYLRTFITTVGDLPVLSIGSGIGVIEAWLVKKGVSVICVDPAPDSYREDEFGRVVMKPKYKTVTEVLIDMPDVVGRCALLLIRAEPRSTAMLQDDCGDAGPDCVEYDIEAIKLLRALYVYSLYCADGADGSDGFHHLLHSINLPCSITWHSEIVETDGTTDTNDTQYTGSAAFYGMKVGGPRFYSAPAVVILFRGEVGLTLKHLPTGDQNPQPLSNEDVRGLMMESYKATADKMQAMFQDNEVMRMLIEMMSQMLEK